MRPLDQPALDRLWAAARRAWQRRGPAGDATVVVARLSAAEAAAIDGLPWPGRHAPILPGTSLRRPLSQLDAALREVGEELLAVLERHAGPVEDPRAERRAARAARAHLLDALAGLIDASGHRALHEWLEGARLLPEDEHRARAAISVVAGLPAPEPIDRAALAARACGGDSHALDPGTALERLVRRLLQQLDGCPDATLGALEVRRLYERFGVEPDPTSSTVLTLGLPGDPGSTCGRVLAATSGHHAVLTYGLLRDSPPRWPTGLRVFVCENPSVVHVAERALGHGCAPLVCTAGWPGSAAQLLLAALRDAGAQLLHHADFDRDGIAMHRHLAQAYGARPWRFDTATYVAAAVTHHGASIGAGGGLDLAEAFESAGVAVVEELVLDDLVRDLALGASGDGRSTAFAA